MTYQRVVWFTSLSPTPPTLFSTVRYRFSVPRFSVLFCCQVSGKSIVTELSSYAIQICYFNKKTLCRVSGEVWFPHPLIPQRKVSVPGNGKIDLEVTFVPSSLGTSEKHTCHIEFSSPQVAELLLYYLKILIFICFFQYLMETSLLKYFYCSQFLDVSLANSRQITAQYI